MESEYNMSGIADTLNNKSGTIRTLEDFKQQLTMLRVDIHDGEVKGEWKETKDVAKGVQLASKKLDEFILTLKTK